MIPTWWMGWAAAWAAEPSTLQLVHELEWARESPIMFAAQVPGAEVATRRAVARALGRLRDPAALEPLLGLSADPDPSVRAEAATALGATPGSASAVREWLTRVPHSERLAGRASDADGERVRLIEALGRVGEASDVAWLTAEAGKAWPYGAAAARALGRLARRKVEGVSAALPELVAALGRPDPRLVEAAAYGVRSVGLGAATPVEVAAVRRAAEDAPTGAARAWLVTALWPALDVEARGDLFVRAVTDPWRVTRVAALDALQPGDLPSEIVSSWVADRDPWLSDAALHAIGRLVEESGEGIEVLQTVAVESEDPWVRAEAVRLGALATDEAVVVRAATVSRLTDRAELLRLATQDPVPAARSAALDALDALGQDVATGRALLASADPSVREVAVEWLAKGEDPEVAAALRAHLRSERDAEVAASVMRTLAPIAKRAPKLVPVDEMLDVVLRRAAAHPTARVRLAARDLAGALGRPLDAPSAQTTRELQLPDGRSVELPAAPPELAEVARIVSARVMTDRGEFTMALDPGTAPLAVSNFALLAEQDFFDGLVFHRVVPGFVAQTGCPRGDGWGGPGWTVPDETSTAPFDVGAVGMARSDHDTGGSQWFVATGDAPHLVGEYTRFGEVVQGMEVVARLRRGDHILDVVVERLPEAQGAGAP